MAKLLRTLTALTIAIGLFASPGTASAQAPGAFGKVSPTNGATAQSSAPTLSWSASSGATSYEYCYYAFGACNNWTSAGTNLSANLSGLGGGLTFFWQVRAINGSGTTYANATQGAEWSFTVAAAPGSFSKTSPSDFAGGQSTSPTLSWAASSNATGYEYCIDTTNDTACTAPATWTNVGSALSIGLSGLSPGTAYYWHVRATNTGGTTYSNGSSGSFWRFTTQAILPAAFSKTSPSSGAVDVFPWSPTVLSWAASAAAVSYEYCLSFGTGGCSFFTNVGNVLTVNINLAAGQPYSWQVRAINAGGTTAANGGTFWTFTTLPTPGGFSKTTPTDLASLQPTNVSLAWGASSKATNYEFCIDNVLNDACNTNWSDLGTALSTIPSGLAVCQSYEWQVRTNNASGTTYGNGSASAFWTFSTICPPGAFSKTSPSDGAIGIPTSASLSWGTAPGTTTSYEYCIDATNDNACSNWTSVGLNTTATANGLSPATPYYWQVRAVGGGSSTYADGAATAFRSFTTGPGAFNRTSPADRATGVSTSPTLNWATSATATSYEYCYDTTNDGACSGWTNVGGNTSVNLSGLNINQPYAWHVRANGPTGTTYANGSATSFGRFTTGSAGLGAAVNALVADPANFQLLYAGTSSGIYRTFDGGATWSRIDSGLSFTNIVSLALEPGNPCSIVAGRFNGTDMSSALAASTDCGSAWEPIGPTSQYVTSVAFSSGSPAALYGTYTQLSPFKQGVFRIADSTTEFYFFSSNQVVATDPNSACTAYAGFDGTGVFRNTTCSGWNWTQVGGNLTGNVLTIAVHPTVSGALLAGTSSGLIYRKANDASPWVTAATLPGTIRTIVYEPGSALVAYAAGSGGVVYKTTDGGSAWSPLTTIGFAITSMTISPAAASSVFVGGDTFVVNIGSTITAPGAFTKLSPADGTTGQSTSPTLWWSPASGATSYEYCRDTIDNGVCDTGWVSVGTATSVSFTGLNSGEANYWHVRANNAAGTTYADGGTSAFFDFTTAPPPGSFGKISPSNGSTGQPSNVTLSWATAGGITSAQKVMAPPTSGVRMPGPRLVLRASPINAFTKTGVVEGALRQQFSVAGATIHVTYNGFSPAAQAAFDYAVNIWASQISSPLPIEVVATWTALEPGVLGEAGASDWIMNFAGAPLSGVLYPIGLANKLAGVDLDPGLPDIDAAFSSTANWYLGTDGNVPAGQHDFVSVVLHELAHGLGFTGTANVNGTQGSWGLGGFPTIYDVSVVNGSGQSVLNTSLFPNPSTALGSLLRSNNLFWDGAGGQAANAGNRPKIYAPAAWNPGSSYSHLDEAAYPAGNDNSLMTPQLGAAEAVHKAGPIALGLFQDWGWFSGQVTYEYCYDTTNDGQCSNWTGTGGATSAPLSGLSAGATHYWQVRATGPNGTTYANGSTSAFWTFTTAGPPPVFSKISPTDGATGESTSPTLTWGASAGATFEYCYDTVNNSACDTSWVSAGASTSAGLSGLAANTPYYWQVRATSAGSTVYANGGAGLFWSFTTQSGSAQAVRFDFTGDLKSDVLWRHVTNGQVWLWPMNGAAKVSENFVRTVPETDWEIRGQGDQNGDGKADILWRNKVTGGIVFWPMNGSTPLSEIFVSTVDPGYDIVGTGDYNGDGKSDILWRHATNGQVWIWLMNGATALSIVHVDTVEPIYAIVGSGDFDGDHKADILWRKSDTGDVWVWLMDGTTRLSQTMVGTVPDLEYQIQGVADFTGDGKADVLWRHTTQGHVWIWPMNGASLVAQTFVGTVDPIYTIEGWGDYNGDNKADILWHHSTVGDVWVWLMDGATMLSQTLVGKVPDLGYRIVKG
jgi:hypothetical protein